MKEISMYRRKRNKQVFPKNSVFRPKKKITKEQFQDRIGIGLLVFSSVLGFFLILKFWGVI